MNAMQVRRSAGEAETSPDPSWRGLYWAEGILAVLFVVLVLAAIALIVVAPPPLNADGATTLQYVASHKVLYTIEQKLWLAPSVFAAVVFLALFHALKHLNKSYAALGALAGFVSWVLGLAIPTTGGGAPVLVYLSDQYMTAATAAQHSEALRPIIGPGYYVYGLFLPTGFLLVGWKLYRLAKDYSLLEEK